MVAAVVGAVFLSGNSLYPKTDTVVAIAKWSELSDAERRMWKTIEYWLSEKAREAQDYVRYTTEGRSGSSVSPRRVFEGTRYESHEAMVAAYKGRAA